MSRRPPGEHQLPLPLAMKPSFSRDAFVVGESNRAAFEAVDAWPRWPSPSLVLVGPEGSGKSHLAALWVERAGAVSLTPAALAVADPTALAAGAVAVEDADRDRAGDVALFHLLNAVASAGGHVLVTARRPPELWGSAVPDLVSRLRAAHRAMLVDADDALLAGVIAKLFADRGLEADPAVMDFLVARMERSLAAAGATVAEIDAAALSGHRAVTRPLVAAVLKSRQGEEPE